MGEQTEELAATDWSPQVVWLALAGAVVAALGAAVIAFAGRRTATGSH
ncbi:hypothetical protein [Nocardiopsis sp. MG754419]|nr:hypothetical protein [Nocardiopsis sp. MG754419]